MREPWPWVTIEAPTPRDSWVVRHFLPLAMIAGFVAAAVFVGAFA